jgi:hypothetical protein
MGRCGWRQSSQSSSLRAASILFNGVTAFLAKDPAMPEPSKPLVRSSPRRPIPLAVRIAYTLFVAVLVPYYWNFYGPANFLWFCDIALLATVPAVWLESRFLASMQLVAVFLPCLVWQADFLTRLVTGNFLTRMTVYMFRSDIPSEVRILSLYHAWFPYLLLWLVWRLGYDRRAWIAQSLLACVVLPVCYFFTDPVRALNGVFGPSGEHPQTGIPSGWYLLLMMAFYPLCVFLPSHLIFRRLFAEEGDRPLQ